MSPQVYIFARTGLSDIPIYGRPIVFTDSVSRLDGVSLIVAGDWEWSAAAIDEELFKRILGSSPISIVISYTKCHHAHNLFEAGYSQAHL